MSREYWLVWSSASEAFVSKGSGSEGDFAQQIFEGDQRGVVVSRETWNKNGGWLADEFRGQLLDQLSAKFAAEVEAGCATPKGRVHCDDQAQSRFLAALRLVEELAARSQPIPPIKWTMWDRSQVDHDIDELKDLGLAMGSGFQLKMARRQELEAEIRAPEITVGNLMAIDLDSGWPT
jgi:hypothetical protein